MKRMFVGLGVVVVASAIGLASCGDDSATSATTAISVRPTNYVTIPPAPSTVAPVTTAVDAPGSKLPYETTYVIEPGDLPSTIASKWKVAFADLMTINNWTLVGSGNSAYVENFPQPGTEIKIPAGATVPGEPVDPSPPTTLAPGQTAPPVTEPATTTKPASTTTTEKPSKCPEGEYTIVDGDFPGKVATKFDTTVGKLNAANANTKGYSWFYPGLVIKIPAPADC